MMGVTFSEGLSPGSTVSYRAGNSSRIKTAEVIQIDTTRNKECFVRDLYSGREFRLRRSEVF
jgi:hypothetical protein